MKNRSNEARIRVDDSITYCPHCGKRLSRVCVIAPTICENCKKPFLCVQSAGVKL